MLCNIEHALHNLLFPEGKFIHILIENLLMIENLACRFIFTWLMKLIHCTIILHHTNILYNIQFGWKTQREDD